jgi:prepilin-type N-terminal cleavage/methylation domain-containing protein
MKLLNLKIKKFSIFNFQFLNKSAFTLLEMLVVIGIISVIVSMGFVSYSTSQKKARDAKRKSDLSTIRNAMEQYYSVCNYSYPTTINSPIQCTSVAPTVMIMPTVPVDPKTTTPYPMPTATGNAYQICTYNLEATSPTGFCLSNQQ